MSLKIKSQTKEIQRIVNRDIQLEYDGIEYNLIINDYWDYVDFYLYDNQDKQVYDGEVYDLLKSIGTDSWDEFEDGDEIDRETLENL